MNYYDTLYSFVPPIIFQYKSCLYIYIIFIVIVSIPIEFNNKKSVIMYIQIRYLCKFSRSLYIFNLMLLSFSSNPNCNNQLYEEL